MTMANPDVRPRRRLGRRLPDDICHECGTRMRKVARALGLRVNGERVTVPNVPHLRCPRCGETLLSYEEAGWFERHALETYRKRFGLLSEQEIRQLRERLGLTQAELAALLHLGSNTVSRWEAGRNVQSASLDMMLRLLRDVPGSLTYLRRHGAEHRRERSRGR